MIKECAAELATLYVTSFVPKLGKNFPFCQAIRSLCIRFGGPEVRVRLVNFDKGIVDEPAMSVAGSPPAAPAVSSKRRGRRPATEPADNSEQLEKPKPASKPPALKPAESQVPKSTATGVAADNGIADISTMSVKAIVDTFSIEQLHAFASELALTVKKGASAQQLAAAIKQHHTTK